MKIYIKPELNVEKFYVEDVIANGSIPTINDNQEVDMEGMSAGMEFDITAEGNEF